MRRTEDDTLTEHRLHSNGLRRRSLSLDDTSEPCQGDSKRRRSVSLPDHPLAGGHRADITRRKKHTCGSHRRRPNSLPMARHLDDLGDCDDVTHSEFRRRTAQNQLRVDIALANSRRTRSPGSHGAARIVSAPVNSLPVDAAAAANDAFRRDPNSRLRVSECNAAASCLDDESRHLFNIFLRQRMGHHPSLPNEVFNDTDLTAQLTGNSMTQSGVLLRHMADEFFNANRHQWLAQLAQRVPLVGLGEAQLRRVLDVATATRSAQIRIFVLFFFCSELVIRVLQESRVDLRQLLLCWIIAYVTDHASNWASQHGGWATALSEMLVARRRPLLALTGLASAVFFLWYQFR